jgi:hypothetical protein
MKHMKTIFDVSSLESGKMLKVAVTLEETKDVETCKPMNTIRNVTEARNADTLPATINSLETTMGDAVFVKGKKIAKPKTQIKTTVRILLIRVLNSAFLTSRQTSVPPFRGRPEPARKEKMD